MDPKHLDGQRVRARVLGAERVPDGEWVFTADDLPIAIVQIGTLTVNYVEPLDYTQFIVNGQPVDPATIEPVTAAPRLRAV